MKIMELGWQRVLTVMEAEFSC